MAVDGWAVTFGTARRGLMGGLTLRPRQAPHCAKYNSPPINGHQQVQYTWSVAVRF